MPEHTCQPFQNYQVPCIYTTVAFRPYLAGKYCSVFFIKSFFCLFLMQTIFKVFIEFVTILLLFFMFCFLAPRHVGS